MFQDKYDSLLTMTTLIRFPNKESEHATGFFYNYNNSTYLITNRHVLEHEIDQPEEISIYFREHSDISETTRLEVPLYNDNFPRWLIHPGFPEADIAALPLNQKLSHVNDEDPNTGSLALSAEVFADPELLIRGGTGARVFGYPEGYIDTGSYFPVVRNGLISSPYGNWFNDRPQFLVDGVMGDGMSGSPVFTQRTTHFEKINGDSHIGGASRFFIGVHAGDYRSVEETHDSKLNLNHVWYAELIEMLLSINGLCGFVDGVEYDAEGKHAFEDINSDRISEYLSDSGMWQLFDPEYNQ